MGGWWLVEAEAGGLSGLAGPSGEKQRPICL